MNPCEWFYNPLKGQPRYVDVGELRQRSQQRNMCLQINAIIDAVLAKGYTITGKKAKEFFSRFNFHCELRKFLEDLLVLDAGVLVKNFLGNSYKKTSAKGFELRTLGKRKLVDLVARDGGSFLKETDVNGVVFCYWQYSYLHPTIAPIEFELAEIAYAQLHPLSYSVYGKSPLEADYPQGFWARLFNKTEAYKLTPEAISEIQVCVENTINRDIMPELGNGKFQFVR